MYKISITKKGFWLMITGVAVMVLGFILMMGSAGGRGGHNGPLLQEEGLRQRR